MKTIVVDSPKYGIKNVFVDDSDFDALNQLRWSISPYGNGFYAMRVIRVEEGQKSFKMHNVIMDTPHGFHTDHIDGNGLNNQKSNLRICTCGQNVAGGKMRANNQSGYRGVVRYSRKNGKFTWTVFMQSRLKKRRYCGSYKTPEEAARVYDKEAKKIFGKFAYQNFPEAK